MKNILDAIYRPSANGAARSMLHVRSSGHYFVQKNWRDRKLRKDFLELFWCARGELEFCCSGERRRLRDGEFCFYLPGDLHDITGRADSTEFFWFTIDGPDLSALMRMFDISRAPRDAGRCPETRFNQLARELKDCSIAGEFKAGATAYEILSLAFAGNSGDGDPVLRKFRDYVEQHFQDPDAGIEAAAGSLRLHRSTLMRLVKRRWGIPPMEYLTSFRMQEALLLLYESDLSIKEIAERCGFRDPNYFSKVVHRRFGKLPSELRNHS